MYGDSIIFITFGGIGLSMVIASFFFWKNGRELVTNGVKTEGKVIDLISHRSSKGGRTFRPMVGFNSMDGRSMTFVGHVGTNPPRHHVGQIVPVIYLPNKPDKAAINSFWDIWATTVVFGAMGGLFLVIAAVTYGII